MGMRKLQADQIYRVVVRGTNWVGDAVMTIPALRALRELLPQSHITLATRPSAKDVFVDADFVDELLVCDTGPEWRSPLIQAREWRHRRFDLAVLLQNAFEPALISFLARVPHRVGYATQGRGMLLTSPLPVPEWSNSRHESFYYLNVIAGLERLLTGKVSSADREPIFDLSVSAKRQAEARAILSTAGVKPGRTLIALCPGSINSRAKRWPAERFAAVADRCIDQLGATGLLVGSPAELEVSQAVAVPMRGSPIILTGKTDLAQAIAILSLVDLLVTNDTGPAHIASALGRPTLVVFGPTNPLTTRPLSRNAEIIRRPPDCAPCMLRDCPIDHRCMTAITPDEVFAHVTQMAGKLQFVVNAD